MHRGNGRVVVRIIRSAIANRERARRPRQTRRALTLNEMREYLGLDLCANSAADQLNGAAATVHAPVSLPGLTRCSWYVLMLFKRVDVSACEPGAVHVDGDLGPFRSAIEFGRGVGRPPSMPKAILFSYPLTWRLQKSGASSRCACAKAPRVASAITIPPMS